MLRACLSAAGDCQSVRPQETPQWACLFQPVSLDLFAPLSQTDIARQKYADTPELVHRIRPHVEQEEGVCLLGRHDRNIVGPEQGRVP